MTETMKDPLESLFNMIMGVERTPDEHLRLQIENAWSDAMEMFCEKVDRLNKKYGGEHDEAELNYVMNGMDPDYPEDVYKRWSDGGGE